MAQTIFDKIIDGSIPSYPVWENDDYLAFLTPFPNTPGVTVVIPKINQGDYAFALAPDELARLVLAAQKVAKLLEAALKTPRVAMVIEGTGVPHVHIKLYPLHGELANTFGRAPSHIEFYPEYVGYLSSAEGPQMDAAQLTKIQAQIRTAS